MKLLEELKQRTSDAKTLVENETRNLAYLEEHYQIILTKIKEFADLGNSSYIVHLPKRYQCFNYVKNKLENEKLIVSQISSYITASGCFGTIENEEYIKFKVSW